MYVYEPHENRPCLVYLVNFTRSIKLIDLLLDNGVFVDVCCSEGNTALHYAVQLLERSSDEAEYKFAVIRLLLQHSADVNARNKRGVTPLHYAVSGSVSYETVKVLLDNGADINAVNNLGQTPIDVAYEARMCGSKALIEYLKGRGGAANVTCEAQYEWGNDPLDW